MKVDLDFVSQVQRKISVEVSAEAVNKEFSSAYGNLGQKARIKGFRPGKAPRSVVRGIYGDDVKSQVLERLVEQSLREAFREKGLQVVSRPEIDIGVLVEGSAFTFSAVVEVKPEIEVKDYLGLEVERVERFVEEEQVEMALSHLQDAHARLEPVESRDVVERGDFVLLDFVGTINGKSFPGCKKENFLLQVNGGNVLPQFEEAIVGLKKDMEHTINVTYPDGQVQPELAGKEVVFRVVVREIKRKVIPSLDDEFAKDASDCASLEELRVKVKAQLEAELREIQKGELKEQLLTQLIGKHPFEIPHAMVDQQISTLMERHQGRPGSLGSTSPEERSSIEQVHRELEPRAQHQVKTRLLIEKISALEKIDISNDELRRKIEEMVRLAKDKAVALREFYHRDDAREDLRLQMVFERTLDFLLERAKVKEVRPPA
ncbi:MAG: trigger factor [Deltaproteobacteria bacterium]|nr:trigger factor [Deltaproteobacteria bacterium]